MVWKVRLLALVVVLVMVAGCAPVIIKPEWGFEKEAVKVHVRADHRLNMYNGRAHTLYSAGLINDRVVRWHTFQAYKARERFLKKVYGVCLAS